MSYSRPFVTSRFVAHEGENRSRALSLGVSLIDAFTEERAGVQARVRLIELRGTRPFISHSGLYCFERVADGKYTLLAEPDPVSADWFFLQPRQGEAWKDTFERPIELPIQNANFPLEVVTLSPKTSYPFPPNATLVRGKATAGSPAADAPHAIIRSTYQRVAPLDSDQTVEVTVETQTDRRGEYVLFFKRLPDATQQVTVTGVRGGQQVQTQVVITEGSTTLAAPLHFP